MATIIMARPWKHPDTGMYYCRLRIPTALIGRVFKPGGTRPLKEWRETLGTKDVAMARRLHPAAAARAHEAFGEAERRLNAVAVTPGKARAIAATWAAWIAADPGRLEAAGEDPRIFSTGPEGKLLAGMEAGLPGTREDWQAREADLARMHADEAAREAGVMVSEDTRGVLLDAMRPVVSAAYREAALRDMGAMGRGARWNPLRAARDALPTVPDAPAPAAPGLSLAEMLDAWAAVAVVKPRTVTETRYITTMLGAFLGHSDAAKITREDMRRWRDASKAEGVTNNTWNNRLSLVRQVFAHAAADGRLSSNPADKALRLAKSKAAARLPYTDDEASRILLAARQETVPTRRWAHWIMAFTGMRVGEVLQLTRGDVRQEGAVWFLAINEDDAGKSVKSGQRRNVPVHPALIAEGLLNYVEGLPPDGPLFPDKALDRHGNRGGRGWNVVGKWVRAVVGIDDAQKPPNHAWRHRVEDELRNAEVPEDARDAIVGHARQTTGRLYGTRGEALARLYRELCKLPVPPGLGGRESAAGDGMVRAAS